MSLKGLTLASLYSNCAAGAGAWTKPIVAKTPAVRAVNSKRVVLPCIGPHRSSDDRRSRGPLIREESKAAFVVFNALRRAFRDPGAPGPQRLRRRRLPAASDRGCRRFRHLDA